MRVAVFASDLTEASHVRTVRALQRAGMTVETFSFRRGAMNASFVPDWPDHPLGTMAHGRPGARLAALARALGVVWRDRQALGRADMVLARNLDMLVLALAARYLCNRTVPVVYQCLDIHGVMTARGPRGRLARWVERRALARTARLVVSAPAFLDRHFGPVQGYAGAAVVMENKILWPGTPPPRPVPGSRAPGALRLGWVGTLRCPQSLALLASAAAMLGDGMEVVLRGVVHRHNLPGFDATLADHPNIRLEAPYAYPEGLAQAYAGLDLVWGQDLWQRGGNSDWLLPNRLYEAGYFGCPLLAVAGTETARRVAQDGAGFVLPDAEAPTLVAFLSSLDPAAIAARRAALLSRPARHFCLEPEDVAPMLGKDAGGRRDRAA